MTVGEKLAAMRRFRLDLQTPSKVQLVEDLFRCLCKEAGVPDADGEGGPAADVPPKEHSPAAPAGAKRPAEPKELESTTPAAPPTKRQRVETDHTEGVDVMVAVDGLPAGATAQDVATLLEDAPCDATAVLRYGGRWYVAFPSAVGVEWAKTLSGTEVQGGTLSVATAEVQPPVWEESEEDTVGVAAWVVVSNVPDGAEIEDIAALFEDRAADVAAIHPTGAHWRVALATSEAAQWALGLSGRKCGGQVIAVEAAPTVLRLGPKAVVLSGVPPAVTLQALRAALTGAPEAPKAMFRSGDAWWVEFPSCSGAQWVSGLTSLTVGGAPVTVWPERAAPPSAAADGALRRAVVPLGPHVWRWALGRCGAVRRESGAKKVAIHPSGAALAVVGPPETVARATAALASLLEDVTDSPVCIPVTQDPADVLDALRPNAGGAALFAEGTTLHIIGTPAEVSVVRDEVARLTATTKPTAPRHAAAAVSQPVPRVVERLITQELPVGPYLQARGRLRDLEGKVGAAITFRDPFTFCLRGALPTLEAAEKEIHRLLSTLQKREYPRDPDLVQLVKARPLRATGAELVVGKEGLTLVGEEAEVAAAGRLLAVARREAVIPAGRAVGCWLQDGEGRAARIARRTRTRIWWQADGLHVKGDPLDVAAAAQELQATLATAVEACVALEPPEARALLRCRPWVLEMGVFLGPYDGSTVPLVGAAEQVKLVQDLVREAWTEDRSTNGSDKGTWEPTVIVAGFGPDVGLPDLQPLFGDVPLKQLELQSPGTAEARCRVTFEAAEDCRKALLKAELQVNGKPVTISPDLQGGAVPKGSGVPYEGPVLLVGEGNFSFAAALALLLGSGRGIVATTSDAEEQARLRHGRRHAHQCRCLGVRLEYEVDPTRLAASPEVAEVQYRFIVFHFPQLPRLAHDPEEADVSVEGHQYLLSAFFVNAKRLLAPGGEVHVTVRDTATCQNWRVLRVAARRGLELVR
eukprot:EG_transcript_1854